MGIFRKLMKRDEVIRRAEALYDAAHREPGEDGVLAGMWATEAEYQALLDAVRELRQAEGRENGEGLQR